MKKISYIILSMLATGCQQTNKAPSDILNHPQIDMAEEITERFLDQTPAGDTINLYTLINNQGMKMEVINFGGIITALTAPDRDGRFEDVVLGFETLPPYLKGSPYFGALVGRYANRIAKGQFTLDGQDYILAKNNQENHLHGGEKGFDKAIWTANPLTSKQGPALELSYSSEHMEEGYPGNLEVKVTYTLRHDNALQIDYHATTDRSTIVNLSQHSYFNLNPRAETILDHELVLNADHYIPVDGTLIPLGTLEPVVGTPFDFRTPQAIGARIDQEHPQIRLGGGYDHCYALNGNGLALATAAVLFDPATGREMTVETTEPGVQFYTGNFLDGSLMGKGDSRYLKRSGLCLETQHFPDSPNQEQFPSARLDPGQTYTSTTVFRFKVR